MRMIFSSTEELYTFLSNLPNKEDWMKHKSKFKDKVYVNDTVISDFELNMISEGQYGTT